MMRYDGHEEYAIDSNHCCIFGRSCNNKRSFLFRPAGGRPCCVVREETQTRTDNFLRTLDHLHHMVPAAGPVKRKRKSEDLCHSNTACKRTSIPPRRGELEQDFFRQACPHRQTPSSAFSAGRVMAAGRVIAAGSRNGTGVVQQSADNDEVSSKFCEEETACFIGEEPTDDESELSSLDSSLDGRSSPSHPAAASSWGSSGCSSSQGTLGFDPASSSLSSGSTELHAAGTAPAFFASQNGPGALFHAAALSSYAMVADVSTPAGNVAPLVNYGQQHYQHQHPQRDGSGREFGQRTDADEWGWFVDAGEDQPFWAHVQPSGVHRAQR